MANIVSPQQGVAPVLPAPQNFKFQPLTLGSNALPINQAQNNNGYKSIFLYVFSIVAKYFSPSTQNPCNGQIYPRSDGATPTIFPE